MTFQCSCAFCESGEVSEVTYQNKVVSGRRRILIDGFKKSVCSACGEEFYTLAQIDSNKDLIESSSRERAGVVFPGLVRGLREDWDLTQKQAAQLFGAGSASVAKWESGKAPSGPSALLVQCAIHVPGVMEYLARLAEIDIKRQRTYWGGDLTAAYASQGPGKAYIRRNCSRAGLAPRAVSSNLFYGRPYNTATDRATQ